MVKNHKHTLFNALVFGLTLGWLVPEGPAQRLLQETAGISSPEHYGYQARGAGDVNLDGFDDLIVGSPGTSKATVVSGKDGLTLFVLAGIPGDSFGKAVSGAGDVDNDGYPDLIVGAPYGGIFGGIRSGSVHVYSGKDGSVLYDIVGIGSFSQFGHAVDGAGDVNLDGHADFLVGEPFADYNGSNSGRAWLYSGIDGSVLYTFDGDGMHDRLGYAVSKALDVNGDGTADILVGAHYDDNAGVNSGSARVFSGQDGSILFTFNGTGAFCEFGTSVSSAGDLNGDGRADLIVGEPGRLSHQGGARVLSGMDGSVLFSVAGDTYLDYFGYSVAGAGDVTGDGVPDFVVGAPFDDNGGGDSGSMRLFSGADGSIVFTVHGKSLGGHFGHSVAAAGDVDADGVMDIVGGSPFHGNRGYIQVLAAVVAPKFDPDLSLISSGVSSVHACGGIARISVQPRDTKGMDLGPGLAVVMDSSAGTLLGAVLDNGDGTYSQELEGLRGADGATVTASVDGVALSRSVSVTFVALHLQNSTVGVNPASIFVGEKSEVVVTPRDCAGALLGSGLLVQIDSTMSNLVGSVVDNGDGTYSQIVDGSVAGAASITAMVDGALLEGTASLTVNDQIIGEVIGSDSMGNNFPFSGIQDAVNAAKGLGLRKILVSPGRYEEVVHLHMMQDLVLATMPTAGLTTVKGFKVCDCSNVVISGFDIDASGTGRDGIRVKSKHGRGRGGGRGVTILGCMVHGTSKKRDGIHIKCKSSQDILVDNCMVENNGRSGMSIAGSEGEVQVRRSWIDGNRENGIDLDKWARVKLMRNRFRWNGTTGKTSAREGYGIIRARLAGESRGHEHEGKRKRKHGRRVQSKASSQAQPERVTLIQNFFQGNCGRIVPGRSDNDIGNYDQMIDPTDLQPPYTTTK